MQIRDSNGIGIREFLIQKAYKTRSGSQDGFRVNLRIARIDFFTRSCPLAFLAFVLPVPPIDSLQCGRIDGCDKFGTGGFEQALVGANKSQRLWAYRCSYQQAASKLNGVVGPQRITINHLRRNIEDDVSYWLSKEPSFCVLL